VNDKRVLWYELVDGEYVAKKEHSGKLTSSLFPGLVLDVKALLKLDKTKVVRALEEDCHSSRKKPTMRDAPTTHAK
jgi:hypothetical protein